MTLFTTRAVPRAANSPTAGVIATLLFTLVSLPAFATVARAQQPPAAARNAAPVQLSLDEALRIAQAQSQTVEVARAGVVRATGQQYQARSQYLPQLNET